MNPKDGKPGSIVAPAAPAEVTEADEADPGEVAEIKADQTEKGEGKYGSTPAPAFKPKSTDDEDDEEKTFIEIELLDEADQPVAGESYEITLPDGSVTTGTLDEKGFARVDGIDPGDCQITFPNLDKEAWEKA